MTCLLISSSPEGAAPWAAIALGVLTLVYITVIRPMRKAKQKDPLGRPIGQVSLAQQRAIERDLSSLLVEYEEMIRRMTAQVDTRSAKLELLIQEADAKLAQLNAALLSVPPMNSTNDGPARSNNSGHNNRQAPRERTQQELFPVEETSVPAIPADGRYAEIYKLADDGRSARQIARQLNRPNGEIELILALREPRARTEK